MPRPTDRRQARAAATKAAVVLPRHDCQPTVAGFDPTVNTELTDVERGEAAEKSRSHHNGSDRGLCLPFAGT